MRICAASQPVAQRHPKPYSGDVLSGDSPSAQIAGRRISSTVRSTERTAIDSSSSRSAASSSKRVSIDRRRIGRRGAGPALARDRDGRRDVVRLLERLAQRLDLGRARTAGGRPGSGAARGSRTAAPSCAACSGSRQASRRRRWFGSRSCPRYRRLVRFAQHPQTSLQTGGSLAGGGAYATCATRRRSPDADSDSRNASSCSMVKRRWPPGVR